MHAIGILALLFVLGGSASSPQQATDDRLLPADELATIARAYRKDEFANLGKLPFVEVHDPSRAIPNSVRGFLLREDVKSFTVLTLSYSLVHVPKPPSKWAGSYHKRDLVAFSSGFLADKRGMPNFINSPQTTEYSSYRRDPVAALLLALACDAQGYDSQGQQGLARQLLECSLLEFREKFDPSVESAAFGKLVLQQLRKRDYDSVMNDLFIKEVPLERALRSLEDFGRRFPNVDSVMVQKRIKAYRSLLADNEAREKRIEAVGEQVDQPDQAVISPIDELIGELRNEDRDSWPQWWHGFDAAYEPADLLVIQHGYAAVPSLIGALNDTRLTRAGLFRRPERRWTVLTVADFADRILCVLSGTPVEGRPLFSQLSEIRRVEVANAHRNWFASVQSKEEMQLAMAALAAGEGDRFYLLKRIIAREPSASFRAISVALAHKMSPQDREQVFEHLALIPADSPVPLLLDQFRSSTEPKVRIRAAELLLRQKNAEGIQAVISHWQSLLQQSSRSQPQEAADLAKTLLASGQLELAQVVSTELQHAPFAVHAAVLESLASEPNIGRLTGQPVAAIGCGNFGTPDTLEPSPDELELANLRAVHTAILKTYLNDTTDLPGSCGKWNGIHLSTRRLCDIAAYALVRITPGEFDFDVTAPLSVRDRQLDLIATNPPATSLHQPFVLSRPLVAVPFVEAKFEKLVGAFVRANPEDEGQLLREIELQEPQSVTRLMSEASGLPPESHKRQMLLHAARRMATTVETIVIPQDSLPLSQSNKERLTGFLGRPLDPKELSHFLSDRANGYFEDSWAFCLDIHRSEQGGIEMVFRQLGPDQLAAHQRGNPPVLQSKGYFKCELLGSFCSGFSEGTYVERNAESNLTEMISEFIDLPLSQRGETRIVVVGSPSRGP